MTVLSDKGIPTPVAWTRLRAPQSLMAGADPSVVAKVIEASPLRPKYATAIDRESAYEMLAARAARAEPAAAEPTATAETPHGKVPEQRKGLVQQVLGSPAAKSMAQSIGKEITRSIFGTRRR